ncbi:MAG: hypothetical protein SVV67_11080 [Bacillota bacterium]|nr:hypothetical protein [Bacillota bacterium]
MVDIDFILNSFSQNRSSAIKTYRKMMQTGKEKLEDYTITPVIGKSKPDSKTTNGMLNNSFINKEIFDDILDDKNGVEKIQRKSLEQLLNNSGATTKEIKLIKKGSRKRILQPFKQTFARLAIEEGYTYEEIGNYIGVSGVAIHKLLKNKLIKSSLST